MGTARGRESAEAVGCRGHLLGGVVVVVAGGGGKVACLNACAVVCGA